MLIVIKVTTLIMCLQCVILLAMLCKSRCRELRLSSTSYWGTYLGITHYVSHHSQWGAAVNLTHTKDNSLEVATPKHTPPQAPTHLLLIYYPLVCYPSILLSKVQALVVYVRASPVLAIC